ncbi:MAG TPA: ABC transporter permease [Candidatus Acidoferrum sp.]|jgi:putative ABC transport system permease protein
MNWLKQLFSRRTIYNDLSDEMRQHLEEKIEELVASGMSRNEATAAARRAFGNLTLLENDSREAWQWPRIESFLADIRYALRTLRNNRGFTFVAVLTLALGVGANTAIFSIVNAVILRPLPYKDSSRMVTFSVKTAMFPTFSLMPSWPAFEAIRTQTSSVESAVACWETDRTLTGTNQPAVLNVVGISDGFFEELGTRAVQGRLLSEADQNAGQDRVAVISNTLWRTRFTSDPNAIGRQLILDNQAYTIVGVAAKGFAYPERAEVWVPISLSSDIKQSSFFSFNVLGKLRKGSRMETLQAELAVIAQKLEQELEKQKPDLKGSYVLTAQTLLDSRMEDARKSYLVLLAAATLVLLIACANLTSLLLARGWARHREMAVRAALGASPGRLRRQVLVESCSLSVLGGLAGIALAAAGIQIFRAIAPPDTARLNEVSMDWTLLWFALASSLLAGLIVGLAPARRAARMSPNELFKQGAGAGIATPSRFGNVLVVAEVALAFILLTGSTLMMQTLAHLLYQNPGFRTDHLLTFDLPQPPKWDDKKAEARTESQIARMKQILTDVRHLPGVEDVAASDHGVLNGLYFSHAGTKLEGVPPEKAAVLEGLTSRYLSPGYFQMLGISLLRGREFEERDARASTKVAIVNEAMARKYWDTLDVVGKRISVSTDAKGNPEWDEIVGVVSNVRDLNIQDEAQPEFFLALFQWGVGSHHLVVRTRTNPEALTDTISRQIWASFPDQPLVHVMTLTRTIADSVGDQRLHTALLGIFAALGLTVALLGIYGVVSYSVARRTQEIGVRMALGAARGDVLRMVLRQGLALVGVGAVIGTAGALGATRVIASELYGVTATDPWTFLGAIALMLLVGCFACLVPARRAMRVDPIVALRYE